MAVETSVSLADVDGIQEIARDIDGKNQWSKAFPRTLRYPDGVSLKDVESLDHDRLLSFAQKLQELGTYEVTLEIFDPFIQPKE